jgi:hypothetical protein
MKKRLLAAIGEESGMSPLSPLALKSLAPTPGSSRQARTTSVCDAIAL